MYVKLESVLNSIKRCAQTKLKCKINVRFMIISLGPAVIQKIMIDIHLEKRCNPNKINHEMVLADVFHSILRDKLKAPVGLGLPGNVSTH